MRLDAKTIAKIALLAAVYAAVTIVLSPISYGPVQVRISESLTLLPYLWGPWAAVGLWIGCMIANVAGGLGLIDILGGSAITLVAGLLTAKAPNLWSATLPPILLNAFGVAGILAIVLQLAYWPLVLYVGLGQAVAVLGIGVPLVKWLSHRRAPRV